jgi:hypothetical protein
MAQYATSGFYAKRANPDGTMATAQRTLGFAGIIDITPVLTTNAAKLQIKVGRSPWQTKTVDFSAATPAALNPTTAAAALNAAAFTGANFSVDDDTGRLKLAAADSSADEVQVYGYLAGALNFGSGRAFEGLGCYYKDYRKEDDTITIQPAVQADENERISQEGSHGTKTTVIIAGGRNGEDLTITTKPLDFEFQQMVQGGVYKRGTQTDPVVYEPPLPGDHAVTGYPNLTIVKIDPIYAPNTESTEGQEIAVKTALYYSGLGKAGDESGGAKSLTQFSYTFNFGVYTDENGVRHANPEHKAYTSSQWEAYDLEALLEPPNEEDA